MDIRQKVDQGIFEKIFTFISKNIFAILILIMLIIIAWFLFKNNSSHGLLSKLCDNLVAFTSPSWQQLIFIIFIVTSVLYKTEVVDLIGRLRFIGKDGAEFIPAQQNAPIMKLNEEQGEPVDIPENTLKLDTVEKNIHVITKMLNKKNFINDSQKIIQLTNDLAAIIFLQRCERVYFQIFGSQINFLRYLAGRPGAGADKNYAEQYFECIKQKHADFYLKGNPSDYYEFLLQAELIAIKNNNYLIAPFGLDFLYWLDSSVIRKDKKY